MPHQDKLLVGIDWADAQHDFHLITPSGEQQTGQFKQKPKDIAEVIEAWRKRAAGKTIAVALEANKGALINALLQYDDVVIYPINPAALAHYRKSFSHGGGKNDSVDAKRLADYLQQRIDELRPLQRDAPITRELAATAQDRRRLVDQRADLGNELTAMLKQYFPAILELNPAKPYAEFLLKFLLAYPTLAAAQAAGKTALRKYFHGIGMKGKAHSHAETIMNAMPLCSDDVTMRCTSRRAVAIAEQLQTLNKHIKQYESILNDLLPKHPDYQVIASLPGAATNTQARIIAALGDDRERYQDAASLQTASGIAPITNQSGRSKHVSARWATTKFVRQTFHEYAGLSITASRWAKAYYDRQKELGSTPQAAKRALAYKWQRIIHRCWKTGEPYNEAHYIERLKTTGSPLYDLIEATTSGSGKSVDTK